MTAKLIDGKKISDFFRAEYRFRVDQLIAHGARPGLAVIIVGRDPASQVYVRNKARACEAIGMHSEVHPLSSDISQRELSAFIETLNANVAVHGILVQLPLPRHIDDRVVIEVIAPAKDVDGFHTANMGALIVTESNFPPCTPHGIMKMLEYESIDVVGKHVVIVGRSNIVGKPMAMMMLKAGATVTVCHSRTLDLARFTKDADILVTAVGKPCMVTGDMLKPGAVVIDVGINRLADGTLAGDVDFESARRVASAITPVPGGVGPMTITMLLSNTLRAAEQLTGLASPATETMLA